MTELTTAFASALFGAYPAWKPLARFSGRGMSVVVTQPATQRVLCINTDGEKITVGFDAWQTGHQSFDPAQVTAEAMRTIDALVREAAVVQVFYREGQWIRSTLRPAGSEVKGRGGEVYEIHSWKMTYDKVGVC